MLARAVARRGLESSAGEAPGDGGRSGMPLLARLTGMLLALPRARVTMDAGVDSSMRLQRGGQRRRRVKQCNSWRTSDRMLIAEHEHPPASRSPEILVAYRAGAGRCGAAGAAAAEGARASGSAASQGGGAAGAAATQGRGAAGAAGRGGAAGHTAAGCRHELARLGGVHAHVLQHLCEM